MSMLYYYGQDGEIADENIKKLFGLGTKELRYSNQLDKDVFDMVGFVYKEDKLLAVFPKHYFSKVEMDSFNQNNGYLSDDIRLLFNVIKKYGETRYTSASARSYLGEKEGYDADYPFKPFYEVYDYFRKYGIYKEREERIVEGASGKVAWKDTIRKSNKIISGGNLIFSPFYVRKKNYNNVFLTECMIFIIDYTIDSFRDFLTLKKTGGRYRFDFINNIDYVIKQLNTYQNRAFKDSQKKLIQSMIDFFIQYRGKAIGGKIHIRIKYFDMIWQQMIGKYINNHFVRIDENNGAAVFDDSVHCSSVKFTNASFNDIDNSDHHFSIDVDHIAFDNNVLYIFDSKYYTEVSELNYKQFSYNEILRYYYPTVVDIHNILLLPGEERVDIHFSLSSKYIGSRTMGTSIIEQYLTPKKVMRDYLL